MALHEIKYNNLKIFVDDDLVDPFEEQKSILLKNKKIANDDNDLDKTREIPSIKDNDYLEDTLVDINIGDNNE